MRRILCLLVPLLILPAAGCGPSVHVTARIVDDHVVFDLKPRGINKIYNLTVEDESGNKIWVLSDPDLYSHQPVVYGALPPGAGEHSNVGQTYPPDDKAPDDIRGKTVIVVVHCQYDSGISACEGDFRTKVRIP